MLFSLTPHDNKEYFLIETFLVVEKKKILEYYL